MDSTDSALGAFTELCEAIIERLRRRLGEIHGEVPSASTLSRLAVSSRSSIAPSRLGDEAELFEIPRRGLLGLRANGPMGLALAKNISGLGFKVSRGGRPLELLVESSPSMKAASAGETRRRGQEALHELREARRKIRKNAASVDWRRGGPPNEKLSLAMGKYERQAQELVDSKMPAPVRKRRR